jgi:acetyltransferase-like isoleucine patch superfamily enzyme
VRLIVDGPGSIVLGDGCELDDGSTVASYAGGVVAIGARAFVGHRSTLAARQRVYIGEGAFLAELVSVRDHDHDPRHPPSSGAVLVDPVHIGADTWLASKVTVVRGVTIGDRTVVGANAVVTSNLPNSVVAVGVPARVIRQSAEH